MLMKFLEFILEILKLLIRSKLSSTADVFLDISDTDSKERNKYKTEHNERLERKKITGVSNSWAQGKIIKICDKNTDIPKYSYFAPFDGYLKKDKDSNKLILDEHKIKFNKSESQWAYGVFSAMFLSCVTLYWFEGFTVLTGLLIVLLGVIGVIALIGCFILSPPGDRKIQEAKDYIDCYYTLIELNDE